MNCMYSDGCEAMAKEEEIRQILDGTLDDYVVDDIIDQLVETFYDSEGLDPKIVIAEAKTLADEE